MPGINSIGLPRRAVSRLLFAGDDVLHLVAGTLLAREPHVRDAELVGVLDLLAQLGGGRCHVGGDATGTQRVGDGVGLGTLAFVPHCNEHTRRGHAVGVSAGRMQHVADQSAQADGQTHARVLAVALGGEIVVTSAGADGAEGCGAVEEGLVHGTGVVVQAAGDLKIRDDGARADSGGLIDDHGQRVQTLAGQRVCLGVGGDAVPGSKGVELLGQLGAVDGGQLGQLKAGLRLALARAAGLDEQLGHLVGTDLVELVDLTQHALDVVKAQATVEAFGKLAVVRMHSRLGQAELAQAFQRGDHDQRQFHLVVVRQIAVADHIDVGLDELAETALLRALATPHLLDLPTLERECEIARMLDHVPAQRHGQIEVQAEPLLNRSVGFVADILQTTQQINLFAGLALLQQRSPSFHGSCLDAEEAIELEYFTERVDDTLLHNTFRGEPLWKS